MIKMILKSHIFFLLVFVLGVSPASGRSAAKKEVKPAPKKKSQKECDGIRKEINQKIIDQWAFLKEQKRTAHPTDFFSTSSPPRSATTDSAVLVEPTQLDSEIAKISVRVMAPGQTIADILVFTEGPDPGIRSAMAWFLPDTCDLNGPEQNYMNTFKSKVKETNFAIDEDRKKDGTLDPVWGKPAMVDTARSQFSEKMAKLKVKPVVSETPTEDSGGVNPQ